MTPSVGAQTALRALTDALGTCTPDDPRLLGVADVANVLTGRLLGRGSGAKRLRAARPPLSKRLWPALRAHVEQHGWSTRPFFGVSMSGYRYNRLALVPGMLHILGLPFLRRLDFQFMSRANPEIHAVVCARLQQFGLDVEGRVTVEGLRDAFGDLLPSEVACAKDAEHLRRAVQRVTLLHFVQLWQAGDGYAQRLVTEAFCRSWPGFWHRRPLSVFHLFSLHTPSFDISTHGMRSPFLLFQSGLWTDVHSEDLSAVLDLI